MPRKDEDDDDDDVDDEAESSISEANTDDPVVWWESWKGEARRAEHASDERAASIVPVDRYRGTAELWRVLESGTVRLVRASYLVAVAKESTVVPRRQELPDLAFMPVPALRAIHANASNMLTSPSFDGLVPIVAVSACWVRTEHADPTGEQLKAIAAVLEVECTKYRAPAPDGRPGFSDVGVFWDWLSLDQPEPKTGKRTSMEHARFESARQDMDLWYGHQGTVVLLLSRMPASAPKARKRRPYDKSGWCTYERAAAALSHFCRPRRDTQCATWHLVLDVDRSEGQAPSWALIDPDTFDAMLEKTTFERKADVKLVRSLYRKQASCLLAALDVLSLNASQPLDKVTAKLLGETLRWCPRLQELKLPRVAGLRDAAVEQLCTSIAATASRHGRLANRVQVMSLDGNALTNRAAAALAGAAEQGALRTLTTLSLGSNRIGAEGVAVLAAASRSWQQALGALTELNLFGNSMGDDGATALANEVAKGALRTVRSLYLGGNRIGTNGCLALSAACQAPGALPELRRLHLYRNTIGKAGAVALAKVLQQWGLCACTAIILDGNPGVSERARRFVVESLARREWARTGLRLWRQHSARAFRLRAARRSGLGSSSSIGARDGALIPRTTPRSQTSRSPERSLLSPRRGAARLPTIAIAISNWKVRSVATNSE